MKPKTMIVLFCVLIVLVVMMQNTQVITVHILFWQILLPQIFLIFLILMAGLVIGYLIGTFKGNAQKR